MPTFQTNSYELVANTPCQLGNLITVVIVESATGYIYFKTTDGLFKAMGGRVYHFPRLTKILSVISAISQSIELTMGEGGILFNSDWKGGGVTPPTSVQGMDPFNSVDQIANFSDPVHVDMMQDVGGGFYHTYPLQSYDGVGLNVASRNVTKGFVQNTPCVEDTTLYQMVRLSLYNFAGGPGNMYVKNASNYPMPIYNTDGTVFSATGVIPSTTPATQELLVPTQGVTRLNISADPGMVAGYAIGYSPQAFLPI